MNILITGSSGLIGRSLCKGLRDKHEVIDFDVVNGDDILDLERLNVKMRHVDIIIHLAALLGNDPEETALDIMRVNLLGTIMLLEAAKINHVKKVVFLSSADVLGVFKGEAVPQYFPMDDEHPCTPNTAYGISKKLAEECCEKFTSDTDIPCIVLRPPGVWSEKTYEDISQMRRDKPSYEYDPYWEYGAFIDVRDLVDIILRVIEAEDIGYQEYLVASTDISTSGPNSLEWCQRLHGEVSVKDTSRYEVDPYASLLDISKVQKHYDWSPKHTWRQYLQNSEDNNLSSL